MCHCHFPQTFLRGLVTDRAGEALFPQSMCACSSLRTDSLRESSLSSGVLPGDQAQVAGLGGRYFYLLSHLTGYSPQQFKAL